MPAEQPLIDAREEPQSLQTIVRKLRTLVGNIPQIIWIRHPDGTLEFLGDQITRFLGLPAPRDAAALAQLVHPEDRERYLSAWDRALRSNSGFEAEYRFQEKSGNCRHFISRATPIEGEKEGGWQWLGTCTDITQQKRNEERYRFLVRAAEEMGSTLDYPSIMKRIAQLAISFGTTDFCFILLKERNGFPLPVAASSQDPAVRTLVEEFQGSGYYPRRQGKSSIYQTLQSGRSILVPEVTDEWLRSIAIDDRHYALLKRFQARSLLNVALRFRDTIHGAMCLISSKAGRRYDLDDLHFFELLGSRAGMAIENAKLYRQARQAAGLRDEFLSVVTHDLKNPLSSILANARMLKQWAQGSPGGEKAVKHSELIESSAHQMLRLVRDLLDFSRIDQNRMEYVLAPVDAGKLLREAVELIEPLARQKGVRLESGLPDREIALICDRQRILQVLSNILGNAIKFTPERGSVTTVVAAIGDEVVFTVKDTGRGIARENIPRIFDRFWQAREAAQLGTGLGLTISKAIVEAHHGSISVESELGKGSFFTIRIPAQARARRAA